ncbi:unnamed protein product [Trifolium pratense]|uniref:Uncharacterized protein n=1 Tax=Trifolium pratense TaxID=57577 RepID=A0ACB0KZR6_TRIPR|nr:unnamed protein product [Trifolium pratense]
MGSLDFLLFFSLDDFLSNFGFLPPISNGLLEYTDNPMI